MEPRFTEEEARAKLGQRVRSLVLFPGLHRGASGTVADIFHVGDGLFELIVKWDRPHPNRACGDWFTKREYRFFLEEIE